MLFLSNSFAISGQSFTFCTLGNVRGFYFYSQMETTVLLVQHIQVVCLLFHSLLHAAVVTDSENGNQWWKLFARYSETERSCVFAVG